MQRTNSRKCFRPGSTRIHAQTGVHDEPALRGMWKSNIPSCEPGSMWGPFCRLRTSPLHPQICSLPPLPASLVSSSLVSVTLTASGIPFPPATLLANWGKSINFLWRAAPCPQSPSSPVGPPSSPLTPSSFLEALQARTHHKNREVVRHLQLLWDKWGR